MLNSIRYGLSWFVASVIAIGFASISYAQNDDCNTVNRGRPTAACEHRGAGCDIGTGPGSGSCSFVRTDRECDCQVVGGFSPATAAVGSALSAPVYVNLYWDANWDADNPSMPKDELDAFTAALVTSSYFGGLSEYNVGAPSFQGGYTPEVQCEQKAPSEVGFYAPFGPSIIGFLQCELDHSGIPKGSQVVYNIILPSGSRESDFFGARKLCDGGEAGWHFHQNSLFA